MPLSRKPNSVERKMNFQQLDVHLENAGTFWRRRLSAELRQARDVIIRKIERGTWTARNDRLPNITKLRTISRKMLEAALQDGQRKMRALKRREKPQRAKQFRQGQFQQSRVQKFIREKAFFITGALEAGLVEEVRNIMVEAIKTGEGISDTTAKVQNVFAPYVGDRRRLEDGEPITPHRAETIVRTNYTEAFNAGILAEAQEADPNNEFIEGYEFSAIIDSRTTEVCTHLDGRVFRPDDPMLARLAPPRHFNCRSVLVPVFIDEEVKPETIISPAEASKGLELSGSGFGRPTPRKTPSKGATAPA